MSITTHTVTAGVIIIVTALASLYTLAMSLNARSGDTISETIRRWSGAHPFVPFALGVLCGHWLAHAVPSPDWGLFALAAAGAGMLAGSIARPLSMTRWQALAVFAIGILSGGLLWSLPTP